MDTKNQLSKIYTTSSINEQGNEDNYTIQEKVNHNQDGEGKSIIIKLLHITQTINKYQLNI
jgi:hypothetical protein